MAIETQELAIIKSGISTAMSASAGEFRQAATASAASITKVVKDISSIFAAQKRDLAELTNSINEVVHELEQTNSKFDTLERVFEESLSIQTAMRGDLKTMAISMKNMTDGIYQLDRNMQNVMTGPNSLLSGLTAGLTSGFGGVTGKLGELLLKVGVPLAAGAAAGGAIGYTMGGGGGGELTNYNGNEKEAKAAADRYAGRTLSGNEWKELVKATHAEAGQKSQTEAAMVMASIINRSRDKNKSIEEVLREPNQFQAVTGTRYNPGPSSAFAQGPGEKRSEQIYGAAANILEKVSKQQKDFTAASSAAYGAGTNIGYRNKMLSSGGSVVGASIFNTAAPSLDNQKTSSSSTETNTDATPVPQSPVTTGSGTSTSQEHDHGGEKQNNKSGGNTSESGKVVQAQTGTRNLPLNDRILGVLQKAASAAGVTAVVTSGAQPDFPKGPRTGSTRHDQSVGAADLHLTQNGRTLTDDNPEDTKIKRKFVEAAVSAGATGIGAAEGYMGKETMHVGFGTPAVWGVGGHKGNVASWLSGLNVGGKGQTPVSEPTQTTPTASTPPAAISPATTSNITPVSEPTQTTPTEQATPVSQEAVTPAVSAPVSSADTSAMMGMMGGGMLPGGLGGILEMIGPMIESLLGSLDPSQAFAQENYQTQNAEMLQTLSKSAAASESIRQAAIQSQAPQLEESTTPSQSIATMPSAPSSVGGYNFQQPGYAYNFDVGWADWAARLGGNHWKEMQKYKESLIS